MTVDGGHHRTRVGEEPLQQRIEGGKERRDVGGSRIDHPEEVHPGAEDRATTGEDEGLPCPLARRELALEGLAELDVERVGFLVLELQDRDRTFLPPLDHRQLLPLRWGA